MAIPDVGTAFSQSATDPFYNFRQFQQDPTFDWTETQPIGGPSGYLEENPTAAWTRYLQGNYGIGVADQRPAAQFMRGQYDNAQRGFQAALAEDPTMIFQRYLGGLPNMHALFAALMPRQRGENVSANAGPLRWIADI